MKRPVDQSRLPDRGGAGTKPPTGGGTGRKPDALIVITVDANKPIPASTLEVLKRFAPVGRVV